MLWSVSCLFGAAIQGREKGPVETPVFPQYYHLPTKGPTLSEFTLRAPVKGKATGNVGTVTFPAPSDYSGQVLISLKVETDPPSMLKNWKWVQRADGLNSVIEATVEPIAKGGWVSYTATVMVPAEPVFRTMNKSFQAWLKPTACVQSADAEVKKLAGELAKGTADRDDYVYKVVMWVAKNQGIQGEALNALDAKRGLKCGGSCTNRANLCAALLRARNIPARTVAHMPTWASGKFYQHWLTEYWTEEGNWAMVEPTIGVKRPARNTVIVLAISSTEDENRAFEAEHLKFSMPGSPYLSLAELSSTLLAADLAQDNAINEIHLLKTFTHPAEARVMTAGYRRMLKVREAASKGVALCLDRIEILSVLAKGPGEFALYLDGRPSQRK